MEFAIPHRIARAAPLKVIAIGRWSSLEFCRTVFDPAWLDSARRSLSCEFASRRLREKSEGVCGANRILTNPATEETAHPAPGIERNPDFSETPRIVQKAGRLLKSEVRRSGPNVIADRTQSCATARAED